MDHYTDQKRVAWLVQVTIKIISILTKSPRSENYYFFNSSLAKRPRNEG